MEFSGNVGKGTMNKLLNFGGDPDHRLNTGIVFRIRHYWEIRKVVSTDCAARRCSVGYAVPGITIATMTSLRHRPATGSGTDIATLVRRALVEVCPVPVLLVFHEFHYNGYARIRHTYTHPMPIYQTFSIIPPRGVCTLKSRVSVSCCE